MGVWGTGLYSNDLAEDICDACRDIYAYYDLESGNNKIFDIFSEYVGDSEIGTDIDNETATFWYVLADWQWKHGILTSHVKSRALSMLNEYAGLSEWIDVGNITDINKRKAVMDLLKLKLESKQPERNIPRVKLKKAKHKSGDIIIFKTCQQSDDEYQNLWAIENLTPPFIFQSEKLFHSKYDHIPVYDAHEKYMALLCIGKGKVKHSNYLGDIFDEYSVYVWYDYDSIEKPTIERLKHCGFLPHIRLEYSDFNSLVIESIGWEYSFILMSESFRSTKKCYELSRTESCFDEVKRFEQAMLQKCYWNSASGFSELYSSYAICWQEKIRASLVGTSIDTLLSENISNPEFLSVNAINKEYEIWKASL